jgi:hypothetical protein
MPSLIAAFGRNEKFDAWGRDQHLPDFVLEHPIGVGDPLAQMHELEPRRPKPHLVRCQMFGPLQLLTQCGLSSMSQRRLALRPHFGQRKNLHDPPP